MSFLASQIDQRQAQTTTAHASSNLGDLIRLKISQTVLASNNFPWFKLHQSATILHA